MSAYGSSRIKGKQILLVDASHCSAAELLKISRIVPIHVMPEPRGSVLLLADFTGAEFDREAITSMKESAVFDRPHLKNPPGWGRRISPGFFMSTSSFSPSENYRLSKREKRRWTGW